MGLFSRKPDRSEPAAQPSAPPASGPAWQGRPLRLPVAPSVATLPQLAATVVEAAADISGARLTYRPADLEVVDAILGGFSAPGSDATAETVWCFGAYLGQTLVESAGGEWIEGRDAELIGARYAVRLPGGGVANPIARAFTRVDEGGVGDLPYFYRVVTEPRRD